MKGGRSFRRRFRGPDGSVVVTEVYLRLDDLDPGDVETDAASVAGQIGLVADLLAEVVELREEADAFYRHWRGERTLAAAKEGLPEWQARAAVEADGRFVAMKRTLARLKGEHTFLGLYLDALQAKGARVRDRIEIERHAVAAAGLPATPWGAEAKASKVTARGGLSRRERIGQAIRAAQQDEDEDEG